jgi:hypothetical protein
MPEAVTRHRTSSNSNSSGYVGNYSAKEVANRQGCFLTDVFFIFTAAENTNTENTDMTVRINCV